ncbi:hypothetical protein [Pseudomonas aeruginosa]|uniref:hypothetical protein n=1 Tax=Pseudomonas aeruginosa TaxID=287 RepID=UPI0008A62659|nr:hypothetical protein [Pseudomonas aeruginosa]EKV3162453.1 hypothetical protein [Pseudomonas aeruginosa]ELQ3403292.1 hypothetical protein [Pseudomonas aeruginosa]EMA3568463.1 hypothetical protein [Pseudomonas aeruginosa]MBA1286433.1 hypothetical protein [Pseudomonas aeruginosa]MCZ7803504.1 hypothetical protein [Pseudomonas aeruginosa]
MAQPLDGFVGFAALDGETDMFYLVTPRAERYQSIQALDEPVVIVVPDFMALDRMVRASVRADLATVVGSLEGNAFQATPGGFADV